MDSLDVLTQSWSLMVIRSITTVSSLYMSPVRALPTASDRAPLPGPRGYASNPTAFVAPWVSRDVVSDVSEVEADFHESLNLVAAASQLGTSCYSLVIMRGADPSREGVLKATLVTRRRFTETNDIRLGTSDHQEFHQNSDVQYFGHVGDLALGEDTGIDVWRSRALLKIGSGTSPTPACSMTPCSRRSPCSSPGTSSPARTSAPQVSSPWPGEMTAPSLGAASRGRSLSPRLASSPRGGVSRTSGR